MRKHSFTDYVSDRFESELYDGVQSFISENYSMLQLRLSKIQSIESIEASDTKVKFITINDLPNMDIEFDVVVEADLNVEDRDYRIEPENCSQWFMLKCIGSLDHGLEDFKIINVSEYLNKSRQPNPMSDSLVPIIKTEHLESVATDFLKKFYPQALKNAIYLDPHELAGNMGLNVKQQEITKDLSVFGQIYFHDCYTELYDEVTDAAVEAKVESRTILVDPKTYFLRNLGSVNNTIVHECVHWDKHRKAFELQRLYDSDLSKIKCQVVGGIKGNNKEATEWMEWQANALTPKIQMPLEMFKLKAKEIINLFVIKLGSSENIDIMEPVIDELATFFGVSRTAAKIRMIEAGYEEAIGAFTYIDGRYIKPHSFKKGALKNNQTFSISASDAAIQGKIDPTLISLISDGSYQYVDAHFVLNHPKYLTQDENGKTVLTRHARIHMEECCLVFELSIKSGCKERYYSECFLNRDKSSGIDFNIVYCGGYEHSSKEKKAELLKSILEEESRFYSTLPTCHRESLKKAIEWKKVTHTEIEKRTGLSAKTISRIISGETQGSTESLVLICLGLHLSPKISNHIIRSSPCPINQNNTDHQWYDFALTYHYAKPMDEIRTFFDENGIKQL